MLPLSGIRVLDLSRLLPGPYCTMLLANMGAEIIKIETPLAGDYLRLTPPAFGFNEMVAVLNRGKKSVALNYRNARGKELFLKLAQNADVVLEAFRPGAMARWGFGYETLKAHNPRLVYCSLSGYGQDGPYRMKGGHDLNYIAIAGLLATNSMRGEPPTHPGVQIADLAGGMLAAMAILGALLERASTNTGKYLDVALMDAALSWTLPLAAGAAARQTPYEKHGVLGGDLPCYHLYSTMDGQYLSLAALEPNFWANFCKTVGHEEWIPRHFDPTLIPDVATLFCTRTRTEWLALFENVDACLEPVQSLAEFKDHPQVKLRAPNLLPVEPEAPLGAHTREVLALSDAEWAELTQKGVVK